MIGVRTIRGRLTVWYVLTMAVIVTGVAVGSWFAMRASLNQTIDGALTRSLKNVKDSIDRHNKVNPKTDLPLTMKAVSTFGLRDLMIRVYDAAGRIIYESESLAAHHLSIGPPPSPGEAIQFRNGPADDAWPVRLAYRSVRFLGEPVVVEVAEPLSVVQGSLRSFLGLLGLAVPLALGLASLGGFWLSGRALAPVERITEGARAISAQNLSGRLAVPSADDELRQLSETLNAMLARIERSVTQIRQFTSDASHELRAPLSLIHTAAEFSLRRDRTNEELVAALQKILRESSRTGQLVNNLLLLARADADTQTIEMVGLDLAAVCREVVDQALVLAAPKRLEVSPNLPVGRVGVRGDEPTLRRLLLILVDNAVKYTAEGGRIALTLSVDAADAVVEVADTGVGIAPADLPHVFDRFWRADKVRSRAEGGTGLGLAIAQWIVGRHDGTLTVESEIGRGSTFTIRLPRSAAPTD